MPTAIVSGALANKPSNGGNAWTRLSWVRGFEQHGFDVYFVEQTSGVPQPAFFDSVMRQFGLSNKSALLHNDGSSIFGLGYADIRDIANSADLLFNISGHLSFDDLKTAPRRRVYYDDDPGYTQLWQEGARLAGHEFYFTIGENIGDPDCEIPCNNIKWQHTRPPVVLTDWPVCRSNALHRFTTVASWRGSYGPVEYAGKRYGVKAHEFRKVIAVPERTTQEFEIALAIDPGDESDRKGLLRHGWKIVDPRAAAGSPETFRQYVQHSDAEFSVAQGIYVETNSGWFSDRTTRYLASGKPVVVQDTGFRRHLPTGEGLLAFRTFEEALECVKEVARDYGRHSAAARKIAEQYFDSAGVVRDLLAKID